MDRSGRVKEGMEHVEVDPLSLHGACPTLLGIKASQVKSHLSTFSSAVDQQQVDQGRCPGDSRQYIFYHSVDQLLTRSGATPAQLHDYACLVTILITACSSCVH